VPAAAAATKPASCFYSTTEAGH